MPLSPDPDLAPLFAAVARTGQSLAPAVPRGDALALRDAFNRSLALVDTTEPDSPNVGSADHLVEVADGAILARWYSKAGSEPGSAVVHFHGGGMVCGSVDRYDRHIAKYVETTGVPILAVDYRLAPEYPGTILVDDGLAALTWLVKQAAEFGLEESRVAVMGDSAGGGAAAGVAIAARDSGISVAKQILLYPMLDDRNVVPDPEIEPFAVWSYDNNFTGWNARLGAARGTAEVSPLIAPARLTDFTGLAPAFIDVGELDILRDESISYATNLMHAGVSTELYVRAGCPHGFDRMSLDVAKRSWADRYRVIKAL